MLLITLGVQFVLFLLLVNYVKGVKRQLKRELMQLENKLLTIEIDVLLQAKRMKNVEHGTARNIDQINSLGNELGYI